MKLQMLTDGKPTNLIKTHALLSQNRKIENALPKENIYVFSFSSPAIQKTSGVIDMEYRFLFVARLEKIIETHTINLNTDLNSN